MNHGGTKTLKTERLLLRPITPEDADDVFTWMGDPEVCKYERWTPHESAAYSCGYIQAVYDYTNPQTYQWGIEREGRLIGFIVIVNIDEHDQKAVMGYALAKAAWSKGYATEAAKAVLAYMFMEVGINRIEANHSINNPASGRVLEKSGFAYEGYAKEYYKCALGFQDSRLYAATRKDYLESQANTTA